MGALETNMFKVKWSTFSFTCVQSRVHLRKKTADAKHTTHTQPTCSRHIANELPAYSPHLQYTGHMSCSQQSKHAAHTPPTHSQHTTHTPPTDIRRTHTHALPACSPCATRTSPHIPHTHTHTHTSSTHNPDRRTHSPHSLTRPRTASQSQLSPQAQGSHSSHCHRSVHRRHNRHDP